MKVIFCLFVCIYFSFVLALPSPFLPYHLFSPNSESEFELDGVFCPANITCAKENDPCDDGNSFCETGYSCDVNSNTCTKPLNNGETCTDYSQCKSFNCVSGVCEEMVAAAIGESCANTSCFDYRAFCNYSSICEAYPVVGETCSGSCVAGAYCNKDTSKCTELFTQQLGANCSDFIECVPGLVCNGTYARPGTCITHIMGSHKKCDSTSDCASHEYCGCLSANVAEMVCINDHEGLFNSPMQATATMNFYNCMVHSGPECLRSSLNGNAYICDTCKEQFCSFINNCVVPEVDPSYIPKKCRYDLQMSQYLEQCNGNGEKKWIPITIGILGGIVGIGVIAGIILWRVRKYKIYEPLAK